MIFSAAGNHKTAVNLFEHHHPCELMGKGHLRHRKLEISSALHLIGQTVGTSDYERDIAASGNPRFLKFGAQFFGGEDFALNAHGVDALTR